MKNCLPLLLTFLFTGCAEKIDTPAEFVEVARKHERDSQPARAVVAYEEALKLAPNASLIWYDLGVSYEQLSQWDQAQEAYSNAIKFDSQLAEAYNNRAAVFARLDRFEEAIQDCDQAIQLNPADPFAWRNRGLARHDLGQVEAAITDYDQAIRLDARNTDTYLYRGNAYLSFEDTVRALRDFDMALQFDPNFGAVMISKAKALSRLDRLEEAKIWLEKAAESGADIGDVELASISEAPAPMPEADPPESQTRLDVVLEYLRDQGQIASAQGAPQGCDLIGEDRSTAYSIRTLNQDGEIVFTDQELGLLEQCPSPVALVVMSENEAPAVVSFVEGWKPERDRMKPHSWSISLDQPASVSAVSLP